MDLKLAIELVPFTAWNRSLYYYKRNKLGKRRRTKELIEKEGDRCWICGKEGVKLGLKPWEYGEENHVQRLLHTYGDVSLLRFRQLIALEMKV